MSGGCDPGFDPVEPNDVEVCERCAKRFRKMPPFHTCEDRTISKPVTEEINKHEKLKELIAKTKGNKWRKDATGKAYPVISDARYSLNSFCGNNAKAFDKLIEAATDFVRIQKEDYPEGPIAAEVDTLDDICKLFTEEQE